MTLADTVSHVRVQAIGATALRALTVAKGLVEPIDGFAESPYRRAGGEVVWLGTRPRVLHPRMIVVSAAPAPGLPFTVPIPDLAPWRPDVPPALDGRAFRARVTRLARAAAEIDTPRGFGALLVGRGPAFPLDLGIDRVRALAVAVGSDDVAAIEAAAVRLLGFGTGLTPSGDDLVGGLLFARRILAIDTPSNTLAARLTTAACERTHSISAALFEDLAMGASYAWLHDLVAALASDAPLEQVLATARTLVGVGHSSGWDMLTGFVLGCTGTLQHSRSVSS